jgi:hypothetical protein
MLPAEQLTQIIPAAVLLFGVAAGLGLSILGYTIVKRIVEDNLDDPQVADFRRAFEDRHEDSYSGGNLEYDDMDGAIDVDEWTDYDDYIDEHAPEMAFQDDFPDEWEEHENW